MLDIYTHIEVVDVLFLDLTYPVLCHVSYDGSRSSIVSANWASICDMSFTLDKRCRYAIHDKLYTDLFFLIFV